ncbi:MULTISPECIES: cation:proton antiporter [unclassified Pseudonocardia]|uniref:cation:proton antiporter domain-containing protein n=1 Tax=unclassified Pseudonocardia TaxID=2619320 RepID=UPI0025F77D7C|nr:MULTISPECIES: cation:proton antiporter [unclassified Pseudonocardia]
MVESIEPFGLTLLVVGIAMSVALLSNRISSRLRIPAPAIFLVGAAAASDLFPALGGLSVDVVEKVVTVALIMILFDGGMGIGVRKLRVAVTPILVVGVVGTLLTAAAMAVLAHLLFGVPWSLALLLGTALAPTDPAVVFSVLGNREVRGRAGVIIEGESGANDPVGIALLVSLLALGGDLHVGAIGAVAGTFAVQMVVGAAVGVGGGWLMLQAIRRLPLPSEGLYPLRTLAISVMLYGLATAAGGSGFLAVFIAGILLGDARAPFKREIERFHSSLAGLAEIVAFVVLGLTVSLSDVVRSGTLWVGFVLAVLLAFVVRPLLVGPLLLAVRLTVGERVFVLWSGLKGAVPILLGTYILAGGNSSDRLAYDVIFVVVAFSVVVQGGLVPTVAARCKVRMDEVEPRPFAMGIRLRDEPESAREYRVGPGAAAEGRTVAQLHRSENVWISVLVRDGVPVHLTGDTVLEAGDEVLLLAEPPAEPGPLFSSPH